MKEHIYMKVEDQTYNVLSYRHLTAQQTDAYGKPKGKADGGIFSITVEFDGNSYLHQWAMSDALTKDVLITVPSRYGTSKSIEIKLEKVHCISCGDNINMLDSEHHTRTIKLSAAKMGLGGDPVFERYWGGQA